MTIRSLVSLGVIGIIRAYQVVIRPHFPRSCRFYPTCSQYCINCIREKGPVLGILLGLQQIAKCHPFSRNTD